MSVQSSPFEQAEMKANAQALSMPKGGGKQANQFYQTAYVQNPGSTWVDKKIVEETSYQIGSQMDGVEPSVMFDELNQTQMSFPPKVNKADKN